MPADRSPDLFLAPSDRCWRIAEKPRIGADREFPSEVLPNSVDRLGEFSGYALFGTPGIMSTSIPVVRLPIVRMSR